MMRPRPARSRHREEQIDAATIALAGAALAASAFPVDATMIDTGDPSTWHGWIHGTAFLVVLPAILAAPVATALALRGHTRWRPLGRVCLAATPAMITLLAVPLRNAGFFLFLAVALGWIAALAARLRRV